MERPRRFDSFRRTWSDSAAQFSGGMCMKTKSKSAMFGMAAMATGLLAFGGSLLAQNAAIAPPAPGADMFYEAMGPGPDGPPEAIGFVEFEEGVSGKTVSGDA